MTTTITAIIFDYGNVLLEWNPRYVYRHFFPDDPEGMEQFFQEVNFMEWNLQQDKGRPFTEVLPFFLSNFHSTSISFKLITTAGSILWEGRSLALWVC